MEGELRVLKLCPRRMYTLLVALLVASPVMGGGPQPPVRIVASTPTLAEMVRSAGRDTVSVESIWDGTRDLRAFKLGTRQRHLLANAALYVGYYTAPYSLWEEKCALQLPEERVLSLGLSIPATSPSGKGHRSGASGERALDPCWAMDAARAVGARLKLLVPSARDRIDRNTAQFRASTAEAMFGSTLCDMMDIDDLVHWYSQGELGAALAAEEVHCELDGWVKQLGTFRGIGVEDPSGLLSSFCSSFGLAMVKQDRCTSGDSTGLKACRVTVQWQKQERRSQKHEQATIDDVVLRLTQEKVFASRDDGYVARMSELINSFSSKLIMAHTRNIVLRAYGGALPSEIALQLDERHVPELLALLNGQEHSTYWRNVLYGLGTIGDERAYEPMVRLLDKRFQNQEISRTVARAMLRVPRALGLLAQETDKAYAYLVKGCQESFWEKRIAWRGAVYPRAVMLNSLVQSCLMGVAVSGRAGPEWIDRLIQETSKDYQHRYWSMILMADCRIWWREKYGMDAFRREERSELTTKRINEYWLTDRAEHIKQLVVPPEKLEKLPDRLR